MVMGRYKELMTGSRAGELKEDLKNQGKQTQMLAYLAGSNQNKMMHNSDPDKAKILENNDKILMDALGIENKNYKSAYSDYKKEKIKRDVARVGTAGAGLIAGFGTAKGVNRLRKGFKKLASEEMFDEKIAGFKSILTSSVKRSLLGATAGAAFGADKGRQLSNEPGADQESAPKNVMANALGGAIAGGAIAGLGGGLVNKGIKGVGNMAKKFGDTFKTASEQMYDQKLAEMNVPTEEEKKKVVNQATDDNDEEMVEENIDKNP
ncbi:MAG: hypothetical protein RR420_01265 [Anaerovoracaceae bacterium]